MARSASLWLVRDLGGGVVEVTHAGVLVAEVGSVEEGLDVVRSSRVGPRRYRGDVEVVEADGYTRTERV